MWYDPIVRSLRFIVYAMTHFAVSLTLVGAFFALEYLLRQVGDPKFFDVVPYRYVLDGIDLVLILISGTFSALDAIEMYRGKR